MFYINLIEKEVTRLSRLDELIQELCPDGVTNQKLRDVTLKITDGMHNLPKTVDEGDYPILSAQNISNRSINFETKKYVDSDTYLKENKRTDVSHGDWTSCSCRFRIKSTVSKKYMCYKTQSRDN